MIDALRYLAAEEDPMLEFRPIDHTNRAQILAISYPIRSRNDSDRAATELAHQLYCHRSQPSRSTPDKP